MIPQIPLYPHFVPNPKKPNYQNEREYSMNNSENLKTRLIITDTTVECPVTSCTHTVKRQRGSFRCAEEFRCPAHNIYISPSTFAYADEENNLLWKTQEDIDLLNKIYGYKREHRLHHNNSEDAVSWNVFRYLESTNLLNELLTDISKQEQHDSELIYWSYSQTENQQWSFLNKARVEFGETINRSSEPDLIVLTANALFFIETKLTASNNTQPSNSTEFKKYLTGGNQWFKQVFNADYETIAISNIKYELLRFWLIGSWIAQEIGVDFYLLNIVPAEKEENIVERFSIFIQQNNRRKFIRISWEDIFEYIIQQAPEGSEKELVKIYYQTKTIGYNHQGELMKAFRQLYTF